MRTPILLLALLPAMIACGESSPAAPSQPPPVRTVAPTLFEFIEDATGLKTFDLRDAQNRIVQVNSNGELIWAADGTRLPGYRATGHDSWDGHRYYFIEGRICPGGCAFEVRFGTEDSERRAYLTVDYGHDNPGTLVDVEVIGGALQVTPTDVYPPGTPTLSGVVTGSTTSGPVGLEGVEVRRAMSTGWRLARTDRNGFYEMRGLIDGTASVEIVKDGYEKQKAIVVIAGNTRFDIEFPEAPSQ
jgi:hypothetical protein